MLGDSLVIEQVIINVLANARDAIRDTTGEEGERLVQLTASITGGELVIAVEDSGGGVSEDVMRDLFEPFFTTKPPNKGAGLGLSIAYSAVTSMHGQIMAENGAKGLRIVIRLPLLESAA